MDGMELHGRGYSGRGPSCSVNGSTGRREGMGKGRKGSVVWTDNCTLTAHGEK